MQARLAAQAEPVKSRGTVLLLHGWGMDATSMLPWAAALADRGWEGWLVDLRGHGGSSDAPAGYGTREAADVAALVAALERDGRLEPPVTLLGVSYGATTALFSEPALRGRVRAIVALAPFSNAGQAVRELVAGSLDDTGGSLHARALRRVARWRYDDPDRIDAAIAMASRTLGLEIDAVDLLPVVAGTDTCTLLLHGGNDDLVPIAHSRRIAAGADVVQLIELASEDHISLPLRVDWLAAPVADWLDAAVADASGEAHGAACPGFPLPADPAIPAE
jgi:pimeloyl-ACP methyl ester carboxylesterase